MSRARNISTVLGSDGSFGSTDITTALGYTPGKLSRGIYFRGSTPNIVVSSSSAVIASGSITVSQNSKLWLFAHSGQIIRDSAATATNPGLYFMIDNSRSYINSEVDNMHSWYGGNEHRIFLTNQGVTTALSAGTHTIQLAGEVYNGSCTFNAQANDAAGRFAFVTVFEELA